ncbi:MAG: hypothetical protein CMN74_00525 [Sphingorhabdus sp.]|nr:hypothetical protein [Sphingorhabdus sp.]|tara:strand:+ start:149 stop:1495 length:1347 start_codon:yes stop_codon:yes gene_type:complete
MRAWLRQTAIKLRGSYWFLPAVLTLGALLLSIITYYVDTKMGSTWLDNVSFLRATKPEGARSLLSTIAGSTIGVAGTVFSITIAAVVYASGSYGPRLLSNFMNDRGNQFTLGIFIATFVYSLMILRVVRLANSNGFFSAPSGQFVPQISMLVALALALLSVAVLVYFLHHVPHSIQINNVVAEIGRSAISRIEKRYPDEHDGADWTERDTRIGEPVRAHRTGYVEVIDYETLGQVAQSQGITVRLALRAGDFVHPGVDLLWVEGTMGEDSPGLLRGAFAVGTSRTQSQDIEFAIDELVEIGLRALSPGINDPFTAITCMHWLSAVLVALVDRDLDRDADGRPYGEDGVYCLADDFAHFVERSFGAMRASAAANDLASKLYVDALGSVMLVAEKNGRDEPLRVQVRRLLDQAREALNGPALYELEKRGAALLANDRSPPFGSTSGHDVP